MAEGVRSTNIEQSGLIDEIVGNRTVDGQFQTVRQPVGDLASQLAATGPVWTANLEALEQTEAARDDAASVAVLAGSYATKTAADAALGDFTNGQRIEITNDGANNGSWIKTGGIWVKQVNVMTLSGLSGLARWEVVVSGLTGYKMVLVDGSRRKYEAVTNANEHQHWLPQRFYASVVGAAATFDSLTLNGTPLVYLKSSDYGLSGYRYALIDANRRVGFGTPYLQKSKPAVEVKPEPYFFTKAVAGKQQVFADPRTGRDPVQVSSGDADVTDLRLIAPGVFGWKSARTVGKAVGNEFYARSSQLVEYPLRSLNAVAMIGDSRVASFGLPAALQTALGGSIPVHNFGVSGQTGAEVLARMDVEPALVTLTGNAIPATTDPVAITYASQVPGTLSADVNLNPLAGTLMGVSGFWENIAGVGYFRRAVAGSVVAVPPKTPFHPTIISRAGVVVPNWDRMLVIMWMEMNSYSQAALNIANYQKAIAAQKGYIPNFIVMGPSTQVGWALPDARMNHFLQQQKGTKALWPDKFADPWGALRNHGNGTTDNPFIAALVQPPSLMDDGTHQTPTGSGWIVNDSQYGLFPLIQSKGLLDL